MTDVEAHVRPKIPFPRPPEWLDEWLAEERTHPDSFRARTCRWCTGSLVHAEHGLQCRETDCKCDCSFTSRDDSWRPRIPYWTQQVNTIMDRYGLDGYVASRMAGSATESSRLRRIAEVTL